MEKKLRKIPLTYYNLSTAQDLWQAHYQILSITTDTMIKQVKLAELNIDIVTVSLNIQTLKMI